MNIIEELAKKYRGEYSEEREKSSIMTSGRYTFHPKQGVIFLDGTKISININAVGGASQTAEPYRIVLHLGENYGTPLKVFPKTKFRRLYESIRANNNTTFPALINKQFSFKGNKGLIEKLANNYDFTKKIENEKVFILIGKKYPKHIVLTPAHGINDLEHIEKFLSILKIIEGKIKGTKQ